MHWKMRRVTDENEHSTAASFRAVHSGSGEGPANRNSHHGNEPSNDPEVGSISSEEEGGASGAGDVAPKSAQPQPVWAKAQLETSLRNLPGGDLWLATVEGDATVAGEKTGVASPAESLTSQQSSSWQLSIPIDNIDVGLLVASFHNNIKLVKNLLLLGANPDSADEEGRTALHYAAASGSEGAVEALLAAGAHPCQWDTSKTATPLHCAAAAAATAALRLLAAATSAPGGGDINAGLDSLSECQRSALHYAVQTDAPECAQVLLGAGARPNTAQVFTETPLHVAAAIGSSQCVALLLEHGADVRVQFGSGRATALHLAAEDGNTECARLLLAAGADPNARNARQQTPLHLAALAQSPHTVAQLLDAGALPNARDHDGRTPLHGAIVKESRAAECARLLIQGGAEVNAADNFGYTPLHIAALNEFSHYVVLLLEKGGDVTARTNGGASVLSFIVRRTPDVLPHLVERLDASVRLHDHEIGDVDCELKLDFRLLVPNAERGESVLLLSLIEVGQRHILCHPLCETFLFLKWRRIRKFFLLSLLFHSVFVLLYSYYAVAVFLRDCSTSTNDSDASMASQQACPCCVCPLNKCADSERERPEDKCVVSELASMVGYAMLSLAILLTIKEAFQLAHGWRAYVNCWENWLQLLIVLSSFLCTLGPHARNISDVPPWQHHVAAVGIFLTWLELMMIVGRFPTFGLYVQMFTTVAVNFSKFLLAYCCLLVAFGLSFGVLFANYPAFKNVSWGLLKTVVMMSGELEFEDIFYDKEIPILYPYTAHFLFLAFVLLVTVVLTNLLVGLAVSDIQGLQKSAGLDRLVRQAELVAHLESMLFSRLLKCLPTKVLAVCHRSALLLSSPRSWALFIRPNDPREHRVPRYLVRRAYELVAERKERARRSRAQAAARPTSTLLCAAPGISPGECESTQPAWASSGYNSFNSYSFHQSITSPDYRMRLQS